MIFREDDPKVQQYPYMANYTDFLKHMERPLLGREREMRQLMAAMSRPELSNVILLAEAGTGKANSVGTILPVADDRGYINLGDVRVGDQVFDENGKPVTVLGVFPQGKLPAYEVVFEDGTSVVCNDEHLWAVRSREQTDSLFHVHTLREMILRGIIKHREMSHGRIVDLNEWYVPANRAVERPEVQLPVEPYTMGILLCHGLMTDLDTVMLRTGDTSLAERIVTGLHAMDYDHCDKNGFWYYIGSENILPAKDSEENMEIRRQVFNVDYKKRSIPSMYLLSSKEQRRDLLRGLMDQNGDVSVVNDKTCVTFNTISANMADSVQTLAASLGYRTKKIQGTEGYAVQFLVSEQMAADLFCSVHREKILDIMKKKNLSLPDRHDVAVSEVRYLDREEEMVCIYVDNPAHLFQITEHHIVTHNTALVQGTMQMDKDRAYLEVNLPKMISNLHNENEMADKLKSLFHEVEAYRKEQDKEIVLFIDEFHQIVQLSSAAVEVLKPLLADSGTRGIRVIAATTYIEYQQHISANLPLVERLQRINLPQPTKEVVINILKGMAKRYGVSDQFTSDAMFEEIYEYTNRYIPANAQPRKSILMLDSMIGWHRADKRPIDMKLLADVIYETEGINIAFRVDATSIKDRLDQVVIAQQFASSSIESRLQICCADLNNKNKPMSSFLFTGSTGVGKTEMSKQLANILFEDERALVRMDMTEYALPDSLERFRLELTQAVWTRPYCIILLDEIEKACAPVTRILLQVLDDGRLLDRNNREVTFKNAYIIVTTNAGSEIYKNIAQYNVDDTGSGKMLEKYESLIRDSIKGTVGGGKFPPELLGRIDCLVPFQPLSENTMATICLMKLNKLKEDIMKKHRISVLYHKRVIPYIVQDKMTTDSDAGGARGVVSRIEREVTTALAKYINAHPEARMGGRVLEVCVHGELVAENKNRISTDAYIEVIEQKRQ